MSPTTSARAARTANRRTIRFPERFLLSDPLPPAQQSIRARCRHPSGVRERTDPPANATIHRMVAAQAARTPERVAVVSHDGALSYRALERAANRLARLIVRYGTPGDAPIVVEGQPRIDTLIATLAVLKAGRFVAFADLSVPFSRNRRLLEHLGARMIVADSQRLALTRDLLPEGIVIDAAEANAMSDDDLDIDVPGNALARIALTSGSTGEPKGIAQSHHAILHGAIARNEAIHFCHEDRLLIATPTFTELWRPLLVGASLCLVDVKREGIESLRRFASAEVSVFRSTPSVFRQLVEMLAADNDNARVGSHSFPSLRAIELMGEPVSAECVRAYQRQFDQRCIMVNFLGAKEVLDYRVLYIDHQTPANDGAMPAGHAFADADLWVVDEQRLPLPRGQVGEIAVATPSMSRGYWRDPASTAERFVDGANGGRVFLTGDRGMLREDGCLLYLGRQDFMVKIRGQRVDMLYVEDVVCSQPSVKQAGVVDVRSPDNDAGLVAFVVPAPGHAFDIRLLRRSLRTQLSDAMMPSAFAMLDTMPTTPMGKIDRDELRARALSISMKRAACQASGSVDEALANILTRVLGLRVVEAHDNLFDLGANSITIIQIAARIERRFAIDVPSSAIFDRPTLAELAAYLRERLGGDAARTPPATP